MYFTKGFTLLELVFVIVIVGILGAAIIPRMERDSLYEAAEQLLSHIKHTQHLAMVDHVYDQTKSDWYKAMWRISFRNCSGGGHYYTVFSDKDREGDADADERALDPLTRKQIYANSSCSENSDYHAGVVLSKKFGIDNILLGGGCFGTNKYVAFDQLGRPHYNLTTPQHLAKSSCTITLVAGSRSAVITIEPETGYTKIDSISN